MESSLAQLKTGSRAKVVRINRLDSTGQRLLAMGITPGVEVKVRRLAPMGDPMDVQVRGYHLLLRKEEAARILVIPSR